MSGSLQLKYGPGFSSSTTLHPLHTVALEGLQGSGVWGLTTLQRQRPFSKPLHYQYPRIERERERKRQRERERERERGRDVCIDRTRARLLYLAAKIIISRSRFAFAGSKLGFRVQIFTGGIAMKSSLALSGRTYELYMGYIAHKKHPPHRTLQ